MESIRVATFNVENLFARYRFRSTKIAETAVVDGWKADARRFSIYDEDSKQITAAAIKAVKADVLALQEVESLDTLKRFRSLYLGGRKAYPYTLLVDGNDPRLIDVAILSTCPIVHVRSHQHLLDVAGKAYVFSRDCLEVDVECPNGSVLTLFVNHFKSLIGGRAATRARRQQQAAAVMDIVTARFGRNPGHHPFIILGDFNDYPEDDADGASGIRTLVDWNQVENVVARLLEDERWTHYYKRQKAYRQLDYLLLSRVLAEANRNRPEIERRGLPKRAARVTAQRFANVGEHHPKASDHCPVVMELKVAGSRFRN